MTIDQSTRLCRHDGVFDAEIHDETVLMSVDRGKYFGLNAVGSLVWERLREPVTVAELADAIEAKFAVSREQCLADLDALLDRMLAEQVIVRV